MLKKFSVKGFKNFKDEIEFDLTAAGYDFNQAAVKDGIVKNAVVYGPNGSGKSNLGYAIFDIVLNLTDTEKNLRRYRNYFNLDTKENKADFYYCFEFNGVCVEYYYTKAAMNEFLMEKLLIDKRAVIEYDVVKKKIFFKLDGASKVNLELFKGGMSFVKYVYRSIALDVNKKQSDIFLKFITFVEHMLLFKSLDVREYIGLMNGTDNIERAIIRSDKLKEFEKFLRKYGIKYDLQRSPDDEMILCKFKYHIAFFSDIASTGTNALTLAYYWFMKLNEVSFLFIDEFDAFYHWDIAMDIIIMLKSQNNVQCVITTHNTDNMDNDVLRPDCYYILKNNVMKSVNNCTDKELREVHNLQKLYRAGKFNGAFKNE